MALSSINTRWSFEDGRLVARASDGALQRRWTVGPIAVALSALFNQHPELGGSLLSERPSMEAIDLKQDPWLASLWAYIEGPKVTREQTGEHLRAVATRLDEVGCCSEAEMADWAKALHITNGEMQCLHAMLVRELEEVHHRLSSTMMGA